MPDQTDLVVETGGGSSTANTYISYTDSNTYWELRERGTATWADATEAHAVSALILATEVLEDYFRGRWKGFRTTEAQALAWPRTWSSDEDGYGVDSDEIPQNVIDAQLLIARQILSGKLGEEDLPAVPSRLSRLAGGGASLDFPGVGKLLQHRVEKMLGGLLAGGNGEIGTLKVAFA